MAEQKGRPKNLRRVHILTVDEDTQEWLSEELDGLRKAFIAGKVSRTLGEAVKGALSHPVGFVAISALITTTIVAITIIPKLKEEGKDGNTILNILEDIAAGSLERLIPLIPGVEREGLARTVAKGYRSLFEGILRIFGVEV